MDKKTISGDTMFATNGAVEGNCDVVLLDVLVDHVGTALEVAVGAGGPQNVLDHLGPNECITLAVQSNHWTWRKLNCQNLYNNLFSYL